MFNAEEEIKKLKYQIDILKSTINSEQYPIESLLLSLNWNEEDLNDAHDIFEIFDNKLEQKEEEISWSSFESQLKSRFNIGYQTIKQVINAFYKNSQWIDVCYHYAKAYKTVEFHQLIRDYENKFQMLEN